MFTKPDGEPSGRDGKPFSFSGPYDDPRIVVQTSERTCGPGNYDYVAHLQGWSVSGTSTGHGQ